MLSVLVVTLFGLCAIAGGALLVLVMSAIIVTFGYLRVLLYEAFSYLTRRDR